MQRILVFALLGVAACAKTPSPTPAPSELALPTAAPSETQTAAQAAAAPVGDVADADQVIAGLRPVFRTCYADGLREDAAMAGRVVFNVQVEPSGKVGQIAVGTRTGRLSDPVVACMSLAIRRATFAPPTSGHVATLGVPVSFVATAAADAPLSEEETGVKRAVTTACANALRKRGATNEANMSRQCECSWGILRRTFTPAEINNAKLVDDPRFAPVQAEATRMCVPGVK